MSSHSEDLSKLIENKAVDEFIEVCNEWIDKSSFEQIGIHGEWLKNWLEARRKVWEKVRDKRWE